MNVRLRKSSLSGSIEAIASKSDAHRLLILASAADDVTRLCVNNSSVDIDTTVECLRKLGADIKCINNEFIIKPIQKRVFSPIIDCMESGSTLRFLLPFASAVSEKPSFIGRGKLPQRPIGELLDTLKSNGVSASNNSLPLTLMGSLKSGEYVLPGNISSQYITGLLLTLPLLEGKSIIKLTSELESSAYVDITLNAMNKFKIDVNTGKNEYIICGKNKYRTPKRITAEGDWSNAGFFLGAGAINGNVTVTGLNINSPQGDKKIAEILKEFGAKVKLEKDKVNVCADNLTAMEVDLKEIPDMLPILAIVASFAKGDTLFYNGARLRLKESDRLKSVAAMINSLGGTALEKGDSLVVRGVGLKGGTVQSFNDHRIVMASAVASLMCDNEVIIKGAEAVNKSYPKFFSDFEKLGGQCNVI